MKFVLLWCSQQYRRWHECQAAMKSASVFIGEMWPEQRFSVMHEKTVTPCANIWTKHLHPIPPSSGLIERVETVVTASWRLSVFWQTSTTDKHLRASLLSVRQQTPALIDWPSCFIWDVSATAGSDWQPRGWGPANQSHGRFLAQVLCSWWGGAGASAWNPGLRSLAASVTASLDIDGRTN